MENIKKPKKILKAPIYLGVLGIVIKVIFWGQVVYRIIWLSDVGADVIKLCNQTFEWIDVLNIVLVGIYQTLIFLNKTKTLIAINKVTPQKTKGAFNILTIIIFLKRKYYEIFRGKKKRNKNPLQGMSMVS